MMDKIGSEVIFLLDLVERINRQEIISNPKEILTWMELCWMDGFVRLFPIHYF